MKLLFDGRFLAPLLNSARRLAVGRLFAGMLVAVMMGAGAAEAKQLERWTAGRTPPLALKDFDRVPHDLSHYRGKVVIVNFWATWCEPCRKEMPSLQELKRTYAAEGLEVLAVNADEPASRVRKFIAEMKLDFLFLDDPGLAAVKAWKATVLPATFIIDKHGRVRFRAVGELDWMAEPQRAAIARLLKEP